MKKNIIYITENLKPPFDEGIKKTAYQIYRYLSENHNVLTICRKGPDNYGDIFLISTNRLFLSFRLWRIIVKFKPDTIVYLPFASSTLASYIRSFVFSLYRDKAKMIMIALQPKFMFPWQERLIPLLKPDLILTPSPQLRIKLDKYEIKNRLAPLLTDLVKYKPVNLEKRDDLRLKYNMPKNKYIICHVGHLNEGRNLQSLIRLQDNDNQIIIVGSSSTPEDAKGSQYIKDELICNGIIVLDHYIEKIEEIYQLSDLYVFPVKEPNSSIGLPLSILEARACGIPVLTTDFGSVKEMLGHDNGSIFYSETIDLEDQINYIKTMPRDHTNSTVTKLNQKLCDILNEEI